MIVSNKQIEYINHTFLKFLGFSDFKEFKSKVSEADVLVESIEDLTGKIYPSQNWIKRIIENSNTQHIIHFKHNKKQPFIVLQNHFKELDKDIVIFSDVTNLELNRLSLNEEILKLKADNEEKLKLLKIQSKQALMGEMISAIAHQWKQPLNALSLNFQIIDIDDINKADLEFCLENGLKQVNYMSKTIDDFRNFFSPNKVMSSFSLKEIIDDVINLFSKQLEVHNINLIVDVDDIHFFGYKSELSQVLMNFIKNSKDEFDKIKKDNKYIKVKAYQKDSFTYVEVEDNAGGIPKEVLSKIFEPYFTTKDKGTGIGLYICKMLIENMQGEIFVDTKDGKTIFTLKLLKG